MALTAMLSFFRPTLWNAVPIDGLLFHLEQTRSALVMCANSRLASAKWLQHKLVGDDRYPLLHRLGAPKPPREQGTRMSEENRTKSNAALASLMEHLKNIDTACEDTRLSAVEKIRRIKRKLTRRKFVFGQ